MRILCTVGVSWDADRIPRLADQRLHRLESFVREVLDSARDLAGDLVGEPVPHHRVASDQWDWAPVKDFGDGSVCADGSPPKVFGAAWHLRHQIPWPIPVGQQAGEPTANHELLAAELGALLACGAPLAADATTPQALHLTENRSDVEVILFPSDTRTGLSHALAIAAFLGGNLSLSVWDETGQTVQDLHLGSAAGILAESCSVRIELCSHLDARHSELTSGFRTLGVRILHYVHGAAGDCEVRCTFTGGYKAIVTMAGPLVALASNLRPRGGLGDLEPPQLSMIFGEGPMTDYRVIEQPLLAVATDPRGDLLRMLRDPSRSRGLPAWTKPLLVNDDAPTSLGRKVIALLDNS